MDVLQPPNPVQSSLHAAPPQSENSDSTNMQIDSLPPPAQESSGTQDAPVDEKPPVVEQAPVAPSEQPEIPQPTPAETVEPEGVKTNSTPPAPVEPSDLMVAQTGTLAPPLEAPVESLKTTPSHERDEEEERPAKRARLEVDAPGVEGSADAAPAVTSDLPTTNGITELAIKPPVGDSLDTSMAGATGATGAAPMDLTAADTSAAAVSATEDVSMGNGVDEAPAKEAPAEPAAPVDPVAPAAHESHSANETQAPDAAAVAATTDAPANGDLKVDTAPAAESRQGEVAATPATPAPEVQKSFDSTPMSKAQKRFMVEQIRKAKKVKNSAAFLTPVDPVALGLGNYFDVIKNPMDLSTIETKLKGDEYASVDDCVADVYLMANNAKLYNGPEHLVSHAGANLLAYVLKCLAVLPKNGEEPPEDPKKAKKPAPEKRASLPRRETTRPPAAAPPTPVAGTASSPTTYALQPGGVPIIRRDSTVDGRPKREIHRPPSKDLPYNNARPRKKKYQLELKFCEHVLKNLLHTRHYDAVHPFYKPVDPVALNIPTYHSVIKKPMDLETIEKKLKAAEYNTAKDFKDDIELMVKNCFKFNVPGDYVHERGQRTEALFKTLWDEKAEWMRENAPQSEPRSEEEDEEEDEEEEEPEETPDQTSRLDALQKQIAALHAEMSSIMASASASVNTGGKKRASPGAAAKKDKKAAKAGGSKKAKRNDSDLATGKASKAAAAPKAKKEKKIPKLTQDQKKEVSDGIGMLDDQGMRKAVQIIRNGVPTLRDVNDDELELDIDEIPDAVVYDLYKFVQSLKPTKSKPSASAAAREPDDAGAYDEPEDDDYNPPARQRVGNVGGGRKKNKPMGAAEQERKIAEIKAQLEGFKEGGTATGAGGSGSSARDSEDDDDESESEEE